MPLTDLHFPVTAKKIGPGAAALTRPKVFYLKSADLLKISADTVRNNAVIMVTDAHNNRMKVELYETPDEFLCAQSLAQGATANAAVTKGYQALAPTSSATASDQSIASKYYNQVSSVNGGYIRLPDPFSRRLVVVDNLTTGNINVLGRGTTSAINGSTAAYVIGPLDRVHFLAPTAATAGTTAPWKTAKDAGVV